MAGVRYGHIGSHPAGKAPGHVVPILGVPTQGDSCLRLLRREQTTLSRLSVELLPLKWIGLNSIRFHAPQRVANRAWELFFQKALRKAGSYVSYPLAQSLVVGSNQRSDVLLRRQAVRSILFPAQRWTG